MTEHDDDDDFSEWLKYRRSVSPGDRLTDRIMSELSDSSGSPRRADAEADLKTDLRRLAQSSAPAMRVLDRVGSVLLVTAASLFFVAKIAALVGNLVFPTESFPEFANEQKIEVPADEHGNVSRS